MTEINKLVEQQCGENLPKRVIFSCRTGYLQCAKKQNKEQTKQNKKKRKNGLVITHWAESISQDLNYEHFFPPKP